MINITTFKGQIEPKLHGASLAKISAFYDKCREAGQNMLLRVDPETLIKKTQISPALYDKVYNYPVPSDLITDAVIDIRPAQDTKRRRGAYGEDGGIPEGFSETFSKEFDIRKKNNTFTIETISGVRTLRLSKKLHERIVLAELDNLTDATESITALGDAQNLSISYLDHVTGDGALQFDLSGATGSGGIAVQLPAPVNLGKLLNQGALFEWLKFTDVTRLSSVTLKYGDNASNYWAVTATQAQEGSFISSVWQLIVNQWSNATITGSPTADGSNILYLEIDFTYSTGEPIVSNKLDSITASLGEIWEVLYYSNCMFTDSTGTTWKDTPTLDSDLIRLDADGLSIFLYEFMLTLQQEIKGKNMAADYSFFKTQLYGQFGMRGIQTVLGLYELFEARYPSQKLNRDDDYYDFAELSGY